MAQTEQISYFDQQQAKKAKTAIRTFVDKLNTWIVQAQENGLPVDHAKIFEYIQEPGKIRKHFDKQAKEEAKTTSLKKMQDQIHEAATETATELTQSLNQCFTIQTAEHLPNERINTNLVLKLKDHFQLSGNQLKLNDSFIPIVDEHFTSYPDEIGHKLYKSLNKAIQAVQRHNDLCIQYGLPDYRIDITESAKRNTAISTDGTIRTQEFCTKPLKVKSEQNLKQLREQAKRPKTGTPTGKEPESYEPTGGRDVPQGKKDPLRKIFTIK